MKRIGMIVFSILCCIGITIMPIFAANETIDASRSTSSTTTFYSGSDGTVAMIVSCCSLLPYFSDGHFDDTTNHDIQSISQDYVYMIRMYNSTDDYYTFNRGLIGVTVTRAEFGSDIYNGGYVSHISATGYNISNIYGDLLDAFSVNTAGMLWGYVSSNFQYNNVICLPPHSSIYSCLTVTDTFTCALAYDNANFVSTIFSKLDRPVQTVTISYPESAVVNANAYVQNADVNSYYTQQQIDNIYDELVGLRNQISTLNNRTYSIMNNVQTITDAYTQNSSNVTDTQSTITEVGTEESQLHQAELNYFLQNEQALQNVGISNFSFSSDQSSGLGSVVSDFTELWNNIGPLQIIFTFTLSMSLATYLLRHRPITGAIRQNERKK